MEAVTRMERDLVLNPNEFAFVLDKTKGDVTVYVGPKQASLSQTDQPVVFDKDTKKFEPTNLDNAIQTFSIAPEGWYVTLKNPARDKEKFHPSTGNANHLTDLVLGRKINIHGPSAFALWPGQMAEVVHGHHLRSNQYLIARVYDEDAARKNWAKAVMKLQTEGDAAEEEDDTPVTAEEIPELTMGKLLVIKGTDVSFYIPPTGVEVVKDVSETDKKKRYLRDAVTLETLEYCILLNEDGNKRFLRGPQVVFPEPTEIFVEKKGARKFRAIELNELQGVYVKVTSAYTEKDGTPRKEGDELFITGNESMIYFPRAEHAIIMRDGRRKHFAIAIPEGEARYVLDREKGTVFLEEGPKMFLPDPRKHVIVRRVLNPKMVELLYPGNREAQSHNDALRRIIEEVGDEAGGEMVRENAILRSRSMKKGMMPSGGQSVSSAMYLSNDSTSAMNADWQEASGEAAADEFQRRTGFTAPPTITIDSKYDGAVAVNIWTGYAMMLVRKSGARRVVEGPMTVKLDYDEIPEVLIMSTGKPKTTDHLLKTVYLRTKNNKIADIIKVMTKDLCEVNIKVSHRVDFIGDDSEAWFGAENYIKILCDHIRSIVRKTARQYSVEEFYQNVEDIVRNAVLGEKVEEGSRPGREFRENSMRIYDTEVLSTTIGDGRIADLLENAQHDVVEKTLELQRQTRTQTIEIDREKLLLELEELRSKTRQARLGLEMAEEEKQAQKTTAQLEAMKLQLALEQENQTASVARDKILRDFTWAIEEAKQKMELESLDAETAAFVRRADAVHEDLVAALNKLGDKLTLKDISEAIAPMSYISGGSSIGEILQGVLGGNVAKVLGGDTPGNGETTTLGMKAQRREKRKESYEQKDWE